MSQSDAKWGTVKEAAQFWRCSVSTVRRWMADGKVTVKRVPSGRPLVMLKDADAFVLERVLK